MRLDGDPNMVGRPRRKYSGDIFIDALCCYPRKDFRNRYLNDSEVVA